jgi:hypothetical protein
MVGRQVQAKAPPPRPSPSRGEGGSYVGWVLSVIPSNESNGLLATCGQPPEVSLHPQFAHSFSHPSPSRGRAGVRGDFGQQPHGIVQTHHDAVEVVADFPVPSPEHGVAARFQPRSSLSVLEHGTGLAMLHAIDLDDEPTLEADKINDVNADRMLTAELQTIRAPLAKFAPDHAFFFSSTCPKSAGECVCHGLGLIVVAAQFEWHNRRSAQALYLLQSPCLYPPPRPSPTCSQRRASRFGGQGEGYVGWECERRPFEGQVTLLKAFRLHTPPSPHPQFAQSFSPPPPLRGRAGVGGDLVPVGKVSL